MYIYIARLTVLYRWVWETQENKAVFKQWRGAGRSPAWNNKWVKGESWFHKEGSKKQKHKILSWQFLPMGQRVLVGQANTRVELRFQQVDEITEIFRGQAITGSIRPWVENEPRGVANVDGQRCWTRQAISPAAAAFNIAWGGERWILGRSMKRELQ